MEPERWHSLNEYDQLANIGSTFYRGSKGVTNYDEFFALLDLTISDPKWEGRTKELVMLREVVMDLKASKNTYQVPADQLNDYFMGFAIAARKNH